MKLIGFMRFLCVFIAIIAMAAPSEKTPFTAATAQQQTDPEMIGWVAGDVLCEGTLVTPLNLHRPMADLVRNPAAEILPVIYAFDIDETGRTYNIHRISLRQRRSGDQDIAPALAASRFASGAAHSDCTIIYRPTKAGLDDAELDDLMAYSVTPLSIALPRKGWERMNENSNCYDDPQPQIKMQFSPNFRALPRTVGARDWVMIGYNIDSSGRTRDIAVLGGTQNEALNKASVEAIDESRYYEGPREGCRYNYWLDPDPVEPPERPDTNAFRPDGATCDAAIEWEGAPKLLYPRAYRRRSIEGWAVITYDVAPSGEVENVRVAAAEPTEDFGNQGAAMMRSAKAKPTEGMTGCVQPVSFRMRDD